MSPTISFEVSRLIRELREDAGLTQSELADRVGTTQSVISRLESDDYLGHSLSMLHRIGAALNRRIAVTAVGDDEVALSVRQARAQRGPERAAQTTISLDVRLEERVRRTAAKEGLSVSAFIARVLDDALERRESRPAPAFRLVTVGEGGVYPGVDLDKPSTLLVADDEAAYEGGQGDR